MVFLNGKGIAHPAHGGRVGMKFGVGAAAGAGLGAVGSEVEGGVNNGGRYYSRWGRYSETGPVLLDSG